MHTQVGNVHNILDYAHFTVVSLSPSGKKYRTIILMINGDFQRAVWFHMNSGKVPKT